MRNPVFMFHGTPERLAPALERQLAAIGRWCEVVPLADLVAEPEKRGRAGRRRAALTFDDGLRSNVAVAYPMLQRLRLPATFFVCPGLIERGAWLWTHEARRRLARLGAPALRAVAARLDSPPGADGILEWMKRLPLAGRLAAEAEIRGATPGFVPSAAEREALDLATWHELRQLDPALVTIGSHTLTHPILQSLDEAQTECEVAASRAAIERAIGRPAEIFCYPNGDVGPLALECVRRHYRAAVLACEDGPAPWDPHRMPRVSEERVGLRGRLGLLRKIWFPYRVAPSTTSGSQVASPGKTTTMTSAASIIKKKGTEARAT